MAPWPARVGIPDQVTLRWDPRMPTARAAAVARWSEAPGGEKSNATDQCRVVGRGLERREEEGQRQPGHQGWGPKLTSSFPRR